MPHIPQYALPAFEGKSKDGLYGDCIEELDHHVGRLLDHLEELGIAEKILVLFLSDNGANPRSRMNAAKKNLPKPGEVNRKLGGSNGPLREGKGTTWEGGIRVPCIAWWPRMITAGRVESTPCSTLDILPTAAALANVTPTQTTPTQTSNTTLDGIDISELLKGLSQSPAQPRMLFHYFGVQLQAVREGNWKLIVPISQLPSKRVPSLWFDHQPELFAKQHRVWPTPALYDLVNDPGETNDLSANYPDVVRQMLQQAQTFDHQFQSQIKPVFILPGPTAPSPNQILKVDDDLSVWKDLIR